MKHEEQKFYRKITSACNQLLDKQFEYEVNLPVKTTPIQWLQKHKKKQFKTKIPKFDNNVEIVDIRSIYEKYISQQKYQSHVSLKQQDNFTPNSLILKVINKLINNKTIELHQLSRIDMMLIQSIIKSGQQKYQNFAIDSNCSIEQLRQIRAIEQHMFKLQTTALKRYHKLLQKQKFFKYWCQKVNEIQIQNRSQTMKITINQTYTKSKHEISKYQSQIQQMIIQNTTLKEKISALKRIFEQKIQDLEQLNNNNIMLQIQCECFQKVQLNNLISDEFEIKLFESNFEKDLIQKLQKLKNLNFKSRMTQSISKIQQQINTIRQKNKLLQKQGKHLKLQVRDSVLISSFRTLKDNQNNNISQKLKHAISKFNQSKNRYVKLFDNIKRCQIKMNSGLHQYFFEWKNKIDQLKQSVYCIQQRQNHVIKMQNNLKHVISTKNNNLLRSKRIFNQIQLQGTKQQYIGNQKQIISANVPFQ